MNLQNILYFNLQVYSEKIITFLDFYSFIIFIRACKELNMLDKHEHIWKNLCIDFKNNFFWELASMRTESDTYIKCDKSQSWKYQLKDIYNYEKLLCTGITCHIKLFQSSIFLKILTTFFQIF